MKEADFKRNLDRWWNNTNQDGHLEFAVIQWFKALAKNIMIWQANKMNSMVKEKSIILKEI